MSEYYWILYFIGAFVVYLSGRASKAVVLGLCCMGLPHLVFFLLGGPRRVYEMEWLFSLSPLLFWGGLALIVIGAARGAGSLAARARPAGYLGDGAHSLASLVIPRDETNSFTRAEALRDDLYQRFLQACNEAGITVVGYKSYGHSGEVWLRFDYRLPQEDRHLSLRSSLCITFERFDYHRFEHLMQIEMTFGTKTRRLRNVIELHPWDIHAINQYLSGKGIPSIRPPRTRSHPLQLWRPRNKVKRLRPDWVVIGSVAVIALLALLPLIGVLLAVCGGVALWWVLRGRKTYVLTTGKPLHDPRNLIRMDSWQANIYGLGRQQEEVRAAILAALQPAANLGICTVPERIWYAGVDGKVEREQIVLCFRRALAFVHLEAYGDDLYLGWDSHINGGTWMEETLARGIDRQSQKSVVANRVTAAWHAVNEYDVTDVSFLTEWLHATLTRMIRLKMEEHKIDQEIDFTVQRESRRGATQGQQAPHHGEKSPQKQIGLRGFVAGLHRVS